MRPYFPKIFLASDWPLRKSSEKSSESVGKASARQGGKKAGRGGWGMVRKKEGGVGGGRPERMREG